MNAEKVRELEMQIYNLGQELHKLRQQVPPEEVSDYPFRTLEGTTTLSELFAGQDKLMVIHNMGQGCRYCTLWADGINPFLRHLETVLSVVLVSRDEPELQRRFANERGWRFRLASHGGGDYIREQTTIPGQDNVPGVACYQRRDGKIYRLGASNFGPGDQHCSLWPLLSLAGFSPENWTPQYTYWNRPEAMDDGGANLKD